MKTYPIYEINAFSEKAFGGNPAAVMPLEEWLPDEILHKLAEQNNLSETAFFVPTSDGFHIRWFTPKVEVDLCGHATLATAYYLFNIKGIEKEEIHFESRSGILTVFKQKDKIYLDFPAAEISPCEPIFEMESGLKKSPIAWFKGKTDYLLVFDSEETILSLNPDFEKLKSLEARGIIVTAESSKFNVDFVSRFFAPRVGINEDPVTGSAHTNLIPYWATELGKSKLEALQVSARGGQLSCELKGNRVLIGGFANLYLKGEVCF
jgi:PhzF family phenazine biosynthesis protein